MDGDLKGKKELGVVPVGGASVVPALTHEFDFHGESGETYEAYSIGGKALVETPVYKLVVTKLPSGQLGLTMIAVDSSQNYLIEKQANFLYTLQDMASDADSSSKIKPRYGGLFPQLIDMMNTGETDRKGVILGYMPPTDSYKKLIPLPVALKGVRVDLQTAVWLLGKTLKLMDFVHVQGFSVGFVDETNLLIEPDLHGIFILNWMDAVEDATDEDQKQDIVALAGIVWRAAGGTDISEPPFDESVMSKAGHDEFVAFLARLMKGEMASVAEEMALLYAMADRIWERVPDPDGYNADKKKRPFHNWVTYPVA